MAKEIDQETLDMVVALWRRRCEWLWTRAGYFDSVDGRWSPQGDLDVEELDKQITKSEGH